jgi:phage tail sheath protein FI
VRIVAGPVFKGDDTLVFPPSAPLAGRIAKTSRERGPWIATGNVPLESVVGLEQALTDEAAEELQDIGLNPLRMSLPRGATIQGVRSLAWPERRAWRFLSVRRLFNYLRRALKPLGLSYTFESNSPATWISMRRDIERLLRDLYAAGALAGATPQEAFFVKIDEALNPEDARQLGVLTAQIGVAPAKPLEFLVVRLIVANSITRVAEEPIIA